MTDLANLVVTLTAETSQYTAGLQKATQSVQKFSKDQTEALDAIKGGLATLAAAFSIEKVVEFGQDLIDANAALVAFSASTGIAVEALSQLEGAAKVNNVQNFDQALTHLEKSIGAAEQGSQSAIEAFRALGITTQDLARLNGDTDAALKLVSDRFAVYADGIGKSAIAQTIFGRNTADMIHFVDQGSESIAAFQKEIDQLGGTVGGELAHNSEEFNSNISKLGIALKGVANEALAQILPDLVEYSSEMVEAAKSTDVLHTASQVLVADFKLMESGLAIVAGVIKASNDLRKDIPGAVGDVEHLALSVSGLASPDTSHVGKLFTELKSDVSGTITEVENQWNGYYKFLADNNAAVAAQNSNIASVRQGALAGVAEVNDQITRSLTDLSGQTLGGFRETSGAIAKTADDAAKAASSSFGAAFAGIAGGAGSAAEQIRAAFGPVEQSLADFTDRTAAAGSAGLPQLKPLDPQVTTQLQNFNRQLEQEVATFGKGSNAARDFALEHGAIAEAIGKVNDSSAKGDAELQKLIATIRSNVAALDALGQAQDVKHVQEFIASLQGQVETFDQGTLAATQYAVEHGKLADQLALTGKRSGEFRAQILSETAALAALHDDKAIQQLNDQMLELTGSTAQAAKSAFALQNAVLASDVKNRLALPVTGNTDAERAAAQAAHDKAQADQDALTAATKLNDAQADANQLLQEFARDQALADAQVQQIQQDIADGNKSTIDGQNAIAEKRKEEQAQLDDIIAKLQAIPGASNIPSVVESIARATTAAKGLNADINALSNTLRTDFVDASSTAFTDFVTGTKSASDAFLEFITDIEKELVNLIAKRYFEDLFDTGGAGGGIVSFLSGLLGGSGGSVGVSAADYAGAYSQVASGITPLALTFERGGPVEATGRPALVGEAGPELLVPDAPETPAASVTQGGTRAPAPEDMPESAYAVGLHGPEIIVPPARGVVVTHQKLLEAAQPRAPEPEAAGVAVAPEPPPNAEANSLTLPSMPHEILVAAEASRPFAPPRSEDPVPLVDVPEPHEAVLLHTERVIHHEAEPQRLLDPREYEELLTDRYLEKRAGGGPAFAGKPYLVGEDGPELFVPPVSGTVMNAQSGWGRSVTVQNNFTIQAPTGSVSKATQVQVGAAAARSVQAAGLRNN